MLQLFLCLAGSLLYLVLATIVILRDGLSFNPLARDLVTEDIVSICFGTILLLSAIVLYLKPRMHQVFGALAVIFSIMMLFESAPHIWVSFLPLPAVLLGFVGGS